MVEWFEDLAIGMRFKSPEKVLARGDIKRFAAEFDPQPFHLDEAAAEKTPLRGLAASGWHTAAVAMRLAIATHPFAWKGEVVELIPSKSKPQGIVKIKWTALNQRGVAVYTFTPLSIVPRRPS